MLIIGPEETSHDILGLFLGTVNRRLCTLSVVDATICRRRYRDLGSRLRGLMLDAIDHERSTGSGVPRRSLSFEESNC